MNGDNFLNLHFSPINCSETLGFYYNLFLIESCVRAEPHCTKVAGMLCEVHHLELIGTEKLLKLCQREDIYDMSCCAKEHYIDLETVKSTFGLSQTSREPWTWTT